MIHSKGTSSCPLLYYMMDNKDAIIASVRAWTEEMLVSMPDHFLVEVKIRPVNNIKVYIDADSGVSLDKLVIFNRALHKKLEAPDFFPEGDFSLEVSSPGLDAPLKLYRQYQKNVGRRVEVQLTDGEKKEGLLLAVSDAAIRLETGGGGRQNPAPQQLDIPFEQIKYTKVCVVF